MYKSDQSGLWPKCCVAVYHMAIALYPLAANKTPLTKKQRNKRWVSLCLSTGHLPALSSCTMGQTCSLG